MEVVVDMRSDTVTLPCVQMRQAIADAKLGDDVFGEDPSTNELERLAAKILGKEAAVFVTTGTMGNLLAIMVHCWGRSYEMLIGDKSHVNLYEQGNSAQYAGVFSQTLANKEDGTFSLEELKAKIRAEDSHYPVTKLVCIENTHNMCGGKVLPITFLQQLREICNENGLLLHCDGARIFNAALALNMDVAQLVQGCDSVTFCLSKGLGAPAGAILSGSRVFIERARYLRKGLGGGMRQSGILAAAGIFALNNNVAKLELDHENAKRIVQVFESLGQSLFKVDSVESNLVFVTTKPNKFRLDANVFSKRMLECRENEIKYLRCSVQVKVMTIATNRVRIVPNLSVDDQMIDMAIKKLEYVLRHQDF